MSNLQPVQTSPCTASLANLRFAYKPYGFVSSRLRTLAPLLLQIYDLQAKLCVQNRRFCKGFASPGFTKLGPLGLQSEKRSCGLATPAYAQQS